MNVLVTGANGFVGKNLCAQLNNIAESKARWYKVINDINVFKYDVHSTLEELDQYCQRADFVFNLAGVNRPQDPKEFMEGNFGFTNVLLDTLKKYKNRCPVMISSSSQAALDNFYGISKKAGEDLMFQYAEETGAKVLVYRFPNLFGKWCRPNYNSAIATFCYNIARGLPINVNDPNTMLNLVYIDDVVDELINALVGTEYREGKFCYVPNIYKVRLGDVVDQINSFDKGRTSLHVPSVSDPFSKALYSTFVSYLPEEKIALPLTMNMDERGSFTEFIRTENHGQISINISKPSITKGQHWHNNSVERFLVVSGQGRIQLRKIGKDDNGNDFQVITYDVDSRELKVIETLPGYTHNIINRSQSEDLVTIIWGNDCFDSNRPDTYFEPVE